MDKITRFVECTIPVSSCNLCCSYCYVIQQNRRNVETPSFRCSPEDIGRAFCPKRWGGLMLVNLCAYGETLLCKELPEIVYYILKQGHYINITNNGTISKQLDAILQKSKGMLSHLCFAFSLHYVELKNKGLLDVFARNVNKVKNAGCSFLVQLNLADEYISCMDEIKEFCMREFGSYPQIALTRRQGSDFSIYSSYPENDYLRYGKSFDSPLFLMTCENFKVKRTEFCYAGDWTFTLDLATGELKSCYFSKIFYNIYDNIDEKIRTRTVGNNCRECYCINSSHFLSLGAIPEIKCPNYVALRDRNNQWYTPEMRLFLSQKLYDNNRQYGRIKRIISNWRFVLYNDEWTARRVMSSVKRRMKRLILTKNNE